MLANVTFPFVVSSNEGVNIHPAMRTTLLAGSAERRAWRAAKYVFPPVKAENVVRHDGSSGK
jgi:hypothetical protein